MSQGKFHWFPIVAILISLPLAGLITYDLTVTHESWVSEKQDVELTIHYTTRINHVAVGTCESDDPNALRSFRVNTSFTVNNHESPFTQTSRAHLRHTTATSGLGRVIEDRRHEYIVVRYYSRDGNHIYKAIHVPATNASAPLLITIDDNNRDGCVVVPPKKSAP